MQNLAKITFSLFVSAAFIMLGSLVMLLASLYSSEFNLAFAQMLGGAFIGSTVMALLMMVITDVITRDKLGISVFQTTWKKLESIR